MEDDEVEVHVEEEEVSLLENHGLQMPELYRRNIGKNIGYGSLQNKSAQSSVYLCS